MNSKPLTAALLLALGLASGAGLARPTVPQDGTGGAGRPAAGQEAVKPLAQAGAQAPSYDPTGRRDPFKDLLGGKDVKEPRGLTGPAALLVEEIQVVGIIKSKGIYKALIAMTNGFPLTAREGDKFADGYILSIRDGEIVFRKTTERGIPLLKPRDIVRDITSEER